MSKQYSTQTTSTYLCFFQSESNASNSLNKIPIDVQSKINYSEASFIDPNIKLFPSSVNIKKSDQSIVNSSNINSIN